MSKHAWFKKIHWSEAESITGRRLDRRRQYYTHTKEGLSVDNPFAFNGSSDMGKSELFTYAEYTHDCSGCTDFGDYGQTYGPFGCDECGYTGKRREGMHTPYEIQKDQS